MTRAQESGVSVSIITPCYNGAPFIRSTLQSALNQTHPPVEIIVIDDGSTDDSAALAESVGPPVRVIRQENGGESTARNRGLAEARGTHVLFLDADDLLAPQALERLEQALRDAPGAVALMGCARFRETPEEPYSVVEARHHQFFPAIIRGNFGPPHTWLAPVSVVRRAGGFCESLRWSEDWDALWRVGLHADGLIPVPYVGARYRRHPASQFSNTSQANRRRGHAAIMARMIPELMARPNLLEAHGVPLFWGAWTALSRARESGVPWAELKPLTDGLHALAARGPAAVTQCVLARVVRTAGARAAFLLHGGQRRAGRPSSLGADKP